MDDEVFGLGAEASGLRTGCRLPSSKRSFAPATASCRSFRAACRALFRPLPCTARTAGSTCLGPWLPASGSATKQSADRGHKAGAAARVHTRATRAGLRPARRIRPSSRRMPKGCARQSRQTGAFLSAAARMIRTMSDFDCTPFDSRCDSISFASNIFLATSSSIVLAACL